MPTITIPAQSLASFYRLVLFAVVLSLPLQGMTVVVERLQGFLHTHRAASAPAPVLVELDLSVLHHDVPSKRRVHARLSAAHQHEDVHRHYHAPTDHTVVVSADVKAAEMIAAGVSASKRLLVDVDGAWRAAVFKPAYGLSSTAPTHEQAWSSSVDPRRIERPPRLA